MYVTFVDFEKVFETLSKMKRYLVAREIGVSEKITNIIKAIYWNYSCRVESRRMKASSRRTYQLIRRYVRGVSSRLSSYLSLWMALCIKPRTNAEA